MPNICCLARIRYVSADFECSTQYADFFGGWGGEGYKDPDGIMHASFVLVSLVCSEIFHGFKFS